MHHKVRNGEQLPLHVRPGGPPPLYTLPPPPPPPPEMFNLQFYVVISYPLAIWVLISVIGPTAAPALPLRKILRTALRKVTAIFRYQFLMTSVFF